MSGLVAVGGWLDVLGGGDGERVGWEHGRGSGCIYAHEGEQLDGHSDCGRTPSVDCRLDCARSNPPSVFSLQPPTRTNKQSPRSGLA